MVREGPLGAPTVVLVHGIPGTVRDFRWLLPGIAETLDCVRFDMPGFGTTPLRCAPGFSMVDRANFIVALLDALGLDKVAVVGHSMGAVAATALAIHHPSRVSHLGLWASPGLRPHLKFRLTFARQVAAMLRAPVLGRGMRGLVRRGFVAQGFPAHMAGATVQTVMDYAAGMEFPAHQRRVLALKVPTMVAYCEDDHLVGPDISAELADACPKGPRAVFQTGGHNLQKTHATALAAQLRDWVGA